MNESKRKIDDGDIWWFREIYSVLCTFADDPNESIRRIDGGTISLPDDQANQLCNFLECIRSKYPQLADTRLIRIATQIEEVLSERSAGQIHFDETFWTNDGFRKHPDWLKIRTISRAFLIQ